jgi:hypothetical protein
MARPFKIDLTTEAERRALVELGLRQYRSPDEQAAFLIREGLIREGALPPAEQKTSLPAPAPSVQR